MPSFAELIPKAGISSALAIACGTQFGAYALSTFGRDEPTEHYYDLSGAATNLLIVAHCVASSAAQRGGLPSPRVALMGALSAAWALRIGSYLYERVQRLGHDARFDKLKKDPMTWRIPWCFQSVWCFSLQAPLAMVAAAGAAAPRLTRMDAIGAAVFVGGLAIETLADVQKDAFKRREPNAPMTEGLFQYSVYANYFGELTLWWGQALLAAPAATSATRVAAAVAAPVVDSLIIWRLSGVPMSEKSVWKKYGASAAYQDYRARTSLFFPLPPASVASPQALAWAKARAAKAVEGAKAQ